MGPKNVESAPSLEKAEAVPRHLADADRRTAPGYSLQARVKGRVREVVRHHWSGGILLADGCSR
jgi:hypothetical protein